MSELNQPMADNLWDVLKVTVDKIYKIIRIHPNSAFLAYVDLKISAPEVLPGFEFMIHLVEVKIINEEAHLDMPFRKGDNGEIHPVFLPLTDEFLEVMTIAVFQNEDISAIIEEAGDRAQCDAAKSIDRDGEVVTAPKKDNPFRETAV